MKNWRKPPNFRGLFPDQPGFANELLKDYLRVEHGRPVPKQSESFERDEEDGAEQSEHELALEKLHRVVGKYLEKNDPISSAFAEIQTTLSSVGRLYYSRRGYHGLRTLFSKWNSETIESDLLASESFIEPLFEFHSPEKYALAHREARNNLQKFAEHLLNHLSLKNLELLAGNREFDRAIKTASGSTVRTLVSIDLCIHNALTGKSFPERGIDESYLIAECYLLDFMHLWKCRPDTKAAMVAMKSALKRIASVIKDEDAPENVLYLSAKKVASSWGNAMQRIELSQDSVLFIHCPFCGQAVMGGKIACEVNPCTHTLFLSTDDVFLYESDFFQSTCERQLDEGCYLMNALDAIAKIELRDAVCFTMVAPPTPTLNWHAAFIGLDQVE